jgi:nicotinamide phosphoribosyltransferase
MNMFPPHLTDMYKTGHIYQYPDGTECVYSNMTARSATHAAMPEDWDRKVVFVGFYAVLKRYLLDLWNHEFFDKPKAQVVARYARRMNNALGKDVVTADHFAALHDLGFLPITVKALPEGSRVNLKVPFFTVQNDDRWPEFYWVTNYIETALSAEVWKPITVATIAYEFRRVLNKYVELTGSSPEFADWQIHDFSMRGLSGVHDAGPVGAAHLMAAGFGGDNIPALDYLEEYYQADSDTELLGGGVPATEHSVMCMGGEEGERETFLRLIRDVYPTGIVSIVSDSWDFWYVITQLALSLKEDILKRQPNALGQAKVVFRPDSGDPVKIIAGLTYVKINGPGDYAPVERAAQLPDVVRWGGKFYEYRLDWIGDEEAGPWVEDITLGAEVPEHVVKGAVECLWDIFGGDITDNGYKTLNQRVGLIYGDSITLEREEAILQRLGGKGFSAGNVVFGVGSYTYQYITRDTFGMAIKATWGKVNGEERELFKDPKTGDGIKKSAKGLLRVEKEGDDFVLYDQQTRQQETQGDLKVVFRNGLLYGGPKLSDIRARLRQ